MPDAPVPYSTNDGTLAGVVDGANQQFRFNPNPTLLLHQVRNVSGHLLFRNGLLVDEYADYATGPGWFLIAIPFEATGASITAGAPAVQGQDAEFNTSEFNEIEFNEGDQDISPTLVVTSTGDVLTGRIFQGLGTAPTKMRLAGIDDGLTAVGDRSLRLSPQRDVTHTI